MRTAADVVSRVRWDPEFDQSHFIVGYLDRFLGIQEKAFTKFQWTKDFHNVLEWTNTVLQHRIMYFKYKGVLVWDKESRLDLVFGSGIPDDAKFKSLEEIDVAFPKGQPGASSDGCAVLGVGDDEEDDDGESPESKWTPEQLASGLLPTPRDRPSHFICIRVTDPSIRRKVGHVQQSLEGADPRLKPGLLPFTRLHVTICTLRLVKQAQLDTACQVLRECQAAMNRMLSPTTPLLNFTGVSSFRERVVYGVVEPLDALLQFQHMICDKLRQAGIMLVGTREEYVPHMTIMKMSRSMSRNIGHVAPSAYSAFRTTPLGSQAIKGIHLCSMVMPLAENGFYYTACSVRNEAPTTDEEEPVPPATALLRDISAGARDGWLDMGVKQALKAQILTAAPQALTSVASEIALRRAQHGGSSGTASGGVTPSSADDLATGASDMHIPPPAMLARRTSELVRQGRVPEGRKAELQQALAAGRASFGQAIATLSSIMGAVADSDDDDDAVETKGSDDAVATTDIHVEGGDRICGHPRLLLSPEDAASQLRALVPAGRPIAIILRGLPGSGKSHFAHSMAAAGFDTAIVCSADDFFMRGGKYSFDASKLGAAHASCQRKFIEAMYDKAPVVIVDNTNTTAKEYAVYQQLAAVFDYMVAVVAFICPDLPTLRVFAQRNQHGVQQTHLEKMWRRMKVVRTDIAVRPWLPEGAIEEAAKAASQSAAQTARPAASSVKSHYVAVFFQDAERAKLLANCAANFATIAANHVTLEFEPSMSSIMSWPIGRTVRVQVLGCFSNDRIQAAPVRLEGVESTNKVPHVTISYVPSAQARESNDLLEEIKEDWSSLDSMLQLEGVVGVCPRTGTAPMLSYADVHSWVARHSGNTAAASFSTHAVAEEETEEVKDGRILHVFDFDSTLFMTPDADVGVTALLAATGQTISMDGWLRAPESLLPPMLVTPGPALADYFMHAGRDRTISTIITGRTTEVLDAVTRVAADFGVIPDRIITKSRLESSTVYKPFALRALLTEFKDIKVVKIWDDDVDCINAYHSMAKSLPGVRFDIHHVTPYPGTKLSLETLLSRMGRLPSDAHAAYVQRCLTRLEACWTRVVRQALPERSQQPLRQLCHLFGSSLVGAVSSDVDVCVLVPASLGAADAVERLRTQLVAEGVQFTYVSLKSRVPKLRFRLLSASHGPLDVDCVFASVPVPTLFPDRRPVPLAEIRDDLSKSSDDESQSSVTSLDGVLFWQDALACTSSCAFTSTVLAAVRVLLEGQRQKGNQFHCLRSFHIMSLLRDFIRRNGAAATSAEQLFAAFCAHVATIPRSAWKKLVLTFVPDQWLPAITAAFSAGAAIAASGDFSKLVARASYPPSGFVSCSIQLSCEHAVTRWQLESFLHARMATFLHKMLDAGLQVVPNATAGEPLEFAVKSGSTMRHALTSIFHELMQDLDTMITVAHAAKVVVLAGTDIVAQWDTTPDIRSLLHGLTPAVLQLIVDFHAGSAKQLVLPETMNADQRKIVHAAATKLGWSHLSQGRPGVGVGRVLVLGKL